MPGMGSTMPISFEEIKRIAAERQAQKASYASTKRWSGKYSTDLLGVYGEAIVSELIGLPIDVSLRANGDPGYDFVKDGVKYDVKATKYELGCHLLEFVEKELVADFYILVYVNIQKRLGRVLGWASKTELYHAEIKDFGYGPRLSIAAKDLHGGLPPKEEHGL